MASNATAEHVAVVLAALAEEFLVDIPAVFDGKGTYLLEFNTAANTLLNSDREWYEKIAEYINNKE